MQISLYRNYFQTLKQEIDVCAGVLDENEIVVAATEAQWVGQSLSKLGLQNVKTYRFNNGITLLIACAPEADVSAVAAVIGASLMALEDIDCKQNDGEYFMKQVINDNEPDIPTRARILKIQSEALRVVYVIRTSTKYVETVMNIIRNMAVGSKDFLFENQSGELVFIRTCKSEPTDTKLYNIAREISEAIATDAFEFVSVGIGMVTASLEELSKSYRSAVNALEIGEIFVNKHKIYAYSNLGISRLISSVPIGKCKAFLNEVLKGDALESIDSETLDTIQKFLDYDLNISLAARELYIHRNTLVYRLDRLQKQTGLDVRKFEDAMLFKIAILIHKYLSATRR
ncbi:MAG: helix-turn-helix domain-containing protein [Clostridia bacterium]|nr:helix-turn-helix domain-containing protein [Clostridia bacterium]